MTNTNFGGAILLATARSVVAALGEAGCNNGFSVGFTSDFDAAAVALSEIKMLAMAVNVRVDNLNGGNEPRKNMSGRIKSFEVTRLKLRVELATEEDQK